MRPNPQETADLVTFTGEILNGKLHFLYSDLTFIISKFAEDRSWFNHILPKSD